MYLVSPYLSHEPACLRPDLSLHKAMHAMTRGWRAATGQDISTWHDIPLYLENGLLSFICEIPKETSAKMEVATVGSLSHAC